MASIDSALSLHPDRLLPPEGEERAIARRLYEAVRDLPVISPHGHVDPRLLPTTTRSPIRRRCSSRLTIM